MPALLLANPTARGLRDTFEFAQICGFIPRTCEGPNDARRAQFFETRFGARNNPFLVGIIDLDGLTLEPEQEARILETAARSGRPTLILTECPRKRSCIEEIRSRIPTGQLYTEALSFVRQVIYCEAAA